MGVFTIPRLTTTSYAILGLLSVQAGSAYDLAQRMQRNYRYFWPRAESKLFEEIKRLAARGLASATRQRVGRRPRTMFRITAAGRRALAAWVREPGAGPQLEFEGLVKITYADRGTPASLLRQLRTLEVEAIRGLALGETIGREYAEGQVALPRRAHVNVLVWRFLGLQYEALLAWTQWAIGEVARWKSTAASPRNLAWARATFAQNVKRMPKRTLAGA